MTLSKYQCKNMAQEEIDAYEQDDLYYEETHVYGGYIIVEEDEEGLWKISGFDDDNIAQECYEGDTHAEVEERREDIENLLADLADWEDE